MKSGDIVTGVLPGDMGKPRPVLIIQSDLFNDMYPSITVVPFTGTITDAPGFRLTLDPSVENGLSKVSQIMIDKVMSVRRARLGKVIGRIGDDTMIRVNRALAVWIGIA